MPGFYEVRHGHDGRKQMAYITSNSYAANWWKATFDQQYPGPSGGIHPWIPYDEDYCKDETQDGCFQKVLGFLKDLSTKNPGEG